MKKITRGSNGRFVKSGGKRVKRGKKTDLSGGLCGCGSIWGEKFVIDGDNNIHPMPCGCLKDAGDYLFHDQPSLVNEMNNLKSEIDKCVKIANRLIGECTDPDKGVHYVQPNSIIRVKKNVCRMIDDVVGLRSQLEDIERIVFGDSPAGVDEKGKRGVFKKSQKNVRMEPVVKMVKEARSKRAGGGSPMYKDVVGHSMELVKKARSGEMKSGIGEVYKTVFGSKKDE